MAERRAEIVADDAILKVTTSILGVRRWRHCSPRCARAGRAMAYSPRSTGRHRARRAFPALRYGHQRDPRQIDRAVKLDDLPPPEIMWEGKYVRAVNRGKWEYAEPCRTAYAPSSSLPNMRAR